MFCKILDNFDFTVLQNLFKNYEKVNKNQIINSIFYKNNQVVFRINSKSVNNIVQNVMEEIKRHTAVKQNYVANTIHHLIKYKIKEIQVDY